MHICVCVSIVLCLCNPSIYSVLDKLSKISSALPFFLNHSNLSWSLNPLFSQFPFSVYYHIQILSSLRGKRKPSPPLTRVFTHIIILLPLCTAVYI